MLVEENAAAPPQALASLSAQNVSYSQNAYFSDCLARRETAADSFTRDNRGFTATITLEKENYVFFSVPYEEGWSATVNGEAVPIVKSSGLMAVPVSGGDNHIVFHYTPPGGTAGIVLTAVSVLGLGVYWTLSRYLAKRKQREKEC